MFSEKDLRRVRGEPVAADIGSHEDASSQKPEPEFNRVQLASSSTNPARFRFTISRIIIIALTSAIVVTGIVFVLLSLFTKC